MRTEKTQKSTVLSLLLNFAKAEDGEKNPEKQAEKIVSALAKAKAAKGKKKTGQKTVRTDTIDSFTLRLVQDAKYTLKQIQDRVCKKYADKDGDVLRHTTKRRLHGYLQKKHGIRIKKAENGVYSVVGKKAKAPKTELSAVNTEDKTAVNAHNAAAVA